jgi:hypothetical protein
MERLLERTVVLNGLRIGRVVDVILDRVDGKAVGFEVRCEDGRHRFLPRAAAAVADDSRTVEIKSPFALLDSVELEFYRRHGATLRGKEPAA